MNRISRLAANATKSAPAWRLAWTLVALGLVALGSAAPGEWGIP